jgi:CRP/FNR family cyclic AMP-dependent transcriptional regulator
MTRVMHQEHEFSDLLLKFLLDRSMRTQADLVDQLFNSSEKRLARILIDLAPTSVSNPNGLIKREHHNDLS